MFLLLRAALGTPSCGIYEASERLLVLFMEGVLALLGDPQGTQLADWLLAEGGV